MLYKITGERNPFISILNSQNQVIYTIQTIGDIHAGKSFRSGVPKSRLGEREEHLYRTFEKYLNTDAKAIVAMGDLFDKTVVSNECLNRIINIIQESCLKNKNTKYFILSGNHDFTKDKDKVSSFDLLIKYFESANISNLHIISKYTESFCSDLGICLYFSHYDPFASLDSLNKVPRSLPNTKLKIAFGHWDVTDFSAISGTEKFINRSIPKVILKNFDLIFTGHEHKPRKEVVETKPVYVTGSMLPYAFGEQLESEFSQYIVLSISELNKALAKNKEKFKNTNVRILYKTNEELPVAFPCLSRTSKCIDQPKPTNDIISNDPVLKTNDEPLSFSKAFLDRLKIYQADTNIDQTYLEQIKNSFLNKDYSKD